MATKRQMIINAVDAALKGIQVDEGYNTNAGSNVFRWKDVEIAQADLPCIEYRDTQDETTPQTVSQHLHKLRIEVRAMGSGTDVDQTARELMADIEVAMGMDITWSGLAEDTVIEEISPDIEIEHKSALQAAVGMAFVIEYVTDRFNPYL